MSTEGPNGGPASTETREPPQIHVIQSPVAVGIKWNVGKVFWTLGVFILAGLAEIGGGWLVWQTVRNKKPWFYFVGANWLLLGTLLQASSIFQDHVSLYSFKSLGAGSLRRHPNPAARRCFICPRLCSLRRHLHHHELLLGLGCRR
ncbi:hypothetical protein Vretimale_12060 [Volvox reticuliferus]|uniref:Uncharacterized protein n=1 Tax=Volvox reticuliferus TaxID=1737510 RepID=A0A8J4GHS0_9CHLO|nr:hypothetical protein Vretifemale_9539 [Volvox reticuliferus]GIM08005.1 hypothetical protein Vretimale_12060 [Volvox reticuliferus]